MKIGNLDVTGIFVGDTEVYKAYLGDVIVYEKSVSVGGVEFTANDASTIGLASLSTNQTLEYSTNGTTWNTMDTSTTINLESGSSVYIRGQLSGNNTSADYTKFTMTGSIAASGNMNYIWNKNNPESTTLSYEMCGLRMFYGCTSLTTAPELPATTLASYCYADMFQGCTNLTTAPELPATTLASTCYYGMFKGCTNLTTAPELPATTLANFCYHSMFYGCTSLTTAPELPATTLADDCYTVMFLGCTSLTSAPELPAKTLAYGCYQSMFNGCTSLNYIKCLATNISATGCTENWLTSVSSTGTFVKNPAMSSWTTGDSGIPTGWTVIDEPFMLKANAASTVGLASLSTNQTLEYSYDCVNWNTMDTNTVINLASGSSVYVQGQLSGNNTDSDYTQFSITGDVSANGKINTIWNKNNPDSDSYARCGKSLFMNCTGLTDASGILFPVQNLKDACYYMMFQDCTNLTAAPELPATSLSLGCYNSMFRNTSITTAPELPATTLATNCYFAMFQGCTSLTTAQGELPATTLTQSCYRQMFQGCTSLNYIKCLATDISATDCTTNWVSNVSSTGTFVKDSTMTSWTTGASGIPTNWTIQNA